MSLKQYARSVTKQTGMLKKMAHVFWGCRRDALSTVNMEETNGRDRAFFQSGKLLYSF